MYNKVFGKRKELDSLDNNTTRMGAIRFTVVAGSEITECQK